MEIYAKKVISIKKELSDSEKIQFDIQFANQQKNPWAIGIDITIVAIVITFILARGGNFQLPIYFIFGFGIFSAPLSRWIAKLENIRIAEQIRDGIVKTRQSQTEQ